MSESENGSGEGDGIADSLRAVYEEVFSANLPLTSSGSVDTAVLSLSVLIAADAITRSINNLADAIRSAGNTGSVAEQIDEFNDQLVGNSGNST